MKIEPLHELCDSVVILNLRDVQSYNSGERVAMRSFTI